MKEERYPQHIREFLIENNKGKSAREITELLNSAFGTDYTPEGIKGLRARMHLVSGLTGHFEKGHVPANKGKKGYCAPGSEKGWFKKGQMPHNHVPVGTEVMTTDGYLKIKVAEPKQWRFKHIMVWEKHNGKVPEGCMISFKDGNHYNCSIENLMCITRNENAILNHQKLRSESAEQTETAVILAKLKHKIQQKKAKGEQTI
ncbi:HNH endonuclease [Treponema bryantii]|uniref:HNH endonuclease n=1 Tax=Treponema bryantii TaxID=163 RepID=A0A1H9G3Y0_9SPIR|nr:HNH endonuclease signature motif containing protein [Treponema bryantii]SEQ44799.1 HNH endonuclease [Treponema bryantii]